MFERALFENKHNSYSGAVLRRDLSESELNEFSNRKCVKQGRRIDLFQNVTSSRGSSTRVL